MTGDDNNRGEEQHLQIFQSRHSLTSEPLYEDHQQQQQQHGLLQQKVRLTTVNSSSDIDDDPQDINERSMTSSQYNSARSPVLAQEEEGQYLTTENQTYTQYEQAEEQKEQQSIIKQEDYQGTQNSERSIFQQFELPHANSKVFDEGDMPIPARFRKNKSKKHLQKSSKGRLNSIKQQIHSKRKHGSTEIEQEGKETFTIEETQQRSRVKDHVNRFIRQSQDLGSTLGLIKLQSSIPLVQSVKQSMIHRPSSKLSPQKEALFSKVLSFNNQSSPQKSQLELLSALNYNAGGNMMNGISCFSGTNNEYGEALSGNDHQYYPPMMLQHHNGNLKGSHSQIQSSIKKQPSVSHKQLLYSQESNNLNMAPHHLHETTHQQMPQQFEELVHSEHMILHDSCSFEGLYPPPYLHQQRSIACPMTDYPNSSEAAFSNNNMNQQDGQQRMHHHIGSNFEQVIQDFKRQNYYLSSNDHNNYQSSSQEGGIATGSESDNFGQVRRDGLSSNLIGGYQQQRPQKQVQQYSNEYEKNSRSSLCMRTQGNNLVLAQQTQYAQSDSSAAEYDCADEDMDGPDSICVDDIILEQNRARVLSMQIEKPIISHSSKQQQNSGEKGGLIQKATTLKNLLFGVGTKNAQIELLQKEQIARSKTTRNSARGQTHQQQHQLLAAADQGRTHSAASTMKAYSFIDNTYLIAQQKQQSLSAKKKLTHNNKHRHFNNIPLEGDSSPKTTIAYTQHQSSASEQQPTRNSYNKLTRPAWNHSAAEVSPRNEYQMSNLHKQYTNGCAGIQQQHTVQRIQKDEKQINPMSTIMESIATIDYHEHKQHHQFQQQQQQPKLQQQIQQTSLSSDVPVITTDQTLTNMQQQHQQQSSMLMRTNTFLNKSLWPPSSIKKTKAGTPAAETSESNRSIQKTQKRQTAYGAEDPYYLLPQQSGLNTNRNQPQSQQLSHHQLQHNKTVLSLNSSRQPTTKHQLESYFMQRSQSNGSSDTRKHQQFKTAAKAKNERSTHRRLVEGRIQEQKQDQSENLIVKQKYSFSPTKKGRGTPRIILPNRTDMTADQLHEYDFEGRGFTDSQQLSLNSDIHNLFGQQNNKQQQQNVMSENSLLPLLQQQTSLMFRTETNFNDPNNQMLQTFETLQKGQINHPLPVNNNQEKVNFQNNHDFVPISPQQRHQNLIPTDNCHHQRNSAAIQRRYKTHTNLLNAFNDKPSSMANPMSTSDEYQNYSDMTGLPNNNNHFNNNDQNHNKNLCYQQVVMPQIQQKSPEQQKNQQQSQLHRDSDPQFRNPFNKRKSSSQSAFQKAIKMTQYLMTEIEKLQQSNQEAAGLVLSENQMAKMLEQNFASEESKEEMEDDQ